jgi:hypothetical protein
MQEKQLNFLVLLYCSLLKWIRLAQNTNSKRILWQVPFWQLIFLLAEPPVFRESATSSFSSSIPILYPILSPIVCCFVQFPFPRNLQSRDLPGRNYPITGPSVSNKCCHDYLHLGALHSGTARLDSTKELAQGTWTYESRNPQLQSSKWHYTS